MGKVSKIETFVNKQTIGKDYFQIPNDYRQVFGRPRFSLTKVSQVEVAREYNEGEIDDLSCKVIEFLKDTTFATADQIARACDVQELSILDDLYNKMYINKFVMSQYDDENVITEADALIIYTLDYGGDYLLSLKGYDMTRWNYTEAIAGAQKVKKGLVQTEVLIGLRQASKLNLDNYQSFPMMTVGRDDVKTDFKATLTSSLGKEFNFLGCIVPSGTEAFEFTNQLLLLDKIFNQTKTWIKYYPMGDASKPHLMVIIQDSSDKDRLLRTIKALAHSSQFSGADVLILGFDDIIKNGFGNSHIYTFLKDNDDKISVRGMSNIFK